jgi:hypothetical protein
VLPEELVLPDLLEVDDWLGLGRALTEALALREAEAHREGLGEAPALREAEVHVLMLNEGRPDELVLRDLEGDAEVEGEGDDEPDLMVREGMPVTETVSATLAEEVGDAEGHLVLVAHRERAAEMEGGVLGVALELFEAKGRVAECRGEREWEGDPDWVEVMLGE